MASAYERRKEPEVVRRALVQCAAAIAGEHGLQAVTVAAVSAAASVTKGALFHHFANKQALVDAMFDDEMSRLDAVIDALVTADPVATGCFTRAYVSAALTMDDETARTWSVLINSMIGESSLTRKWSDWIKERLRMHESTDRAPGLSLVRMAVDGVWLNMLSSATRPGAGELSEIKAQLLAMTAPTR